MKTFITILLSLIVGASLAVVISTNVVLKIVDSRIQDNNTKLAEKTEAIPLPTIVEKISFTNTTHSIVQIVEFSNTELKTYGSGTIVTSNGYIVTNYHVIKSLKEPKIMLSNTEVYDLQIIGIDAQNDIVLLKIPASNLPSVTFADSDDVTIGDEVFTLGNPLDLGPTVTSGIVCAKNRDIDILPGKESFIQTDAVLDSGNSGGILINTEGEVIGITTAVYNQYGFAIPSNIVVQTINNFLK